MRLFITKFVFWILITTFTSLSLASSSHHYFTKQVEKIDSQPQTLHQLNDVGDYYNVTSGTVQFRRKDISIPGNSELEVAYSLTYETSFPDYFGWTEDVPRIEISSGVGSYGGENTPLSWLNGQSCSGSQHAYNGIPIDVLGDVGSYIYHDRAKLIIPSLKINSYLLVNNGFLAKDVIKYPYVTTNNWRFECFNSTNTGEEGFKAVSPEGIAYYFDHKAKYIRNLKGVAPQTPFSAIIDSSVAAHIKKVPKALFVSKIEDRFGNWVKYEYDASNISRIFSNDGRNISVKKDNKGSSVYSEGKMWRYDILNKGSGTSTGNNRNDLIVTQPDGQQWKYELDISETISTSNSDGDPICSRQFKPNHSTMQPMKVTSPYGAITEFKFDFIRTDHSNIDSTRFHRTDDFMRCHYSYVLKERTVTFNDKVMKDTYEYSENYGVFDIEADNPNPASLLPFPTPSGVSRVDNKSITQTLSNGSKKKYYINRKFRTGEFNTLSAIEYYDANQKRPTLTESFAYNLSGAKGNAYNTARDSFEITPRLSSHKKMYSNGDVIIVRYTGFNQFDMPSHKSVTDESTGYVRYWKEDFVHDLNAWLLNLPSKTYVSETPSYANAYKETVYNSQYQPYQEKSFGQIITTHTYHADGNLFKTLHTDSNRYQQFDSYYRDQPRKITYPCPTTNGCNTVNGSSTNTSIALLEVNGDGTLKSISDFNGNITHYRYNDMKWLTEVDYANTKWADKFIGYSTVTNAGDGISGSGILPGMLRKTILQGNHQEHVYYDGVLRPIYTREQDITDNQTTRYQAFEYDNQNRQTLVSFASDNPSRRLGIMTKYDVLDRVTRQSRTSDDAISHTKYLAGNKRAVTDPIGNTTTTTFLTYDSSANDKAILIEAPNSDDITIDYNQYNQTTHISQGRVTETHLYDRYQQLCKSVRPETGVTAYGYNNQRQLRWKAEGTNGGHSSCSPLSVTESDKVLFSYDNLGQLKSEYYFDRTPQKKYLYDGNGNLVRLTATSGNNETMWHYEYNSMNQVEKEVLLHDGKIFALEWIYNNVGDVASLIYPSGRKIDFNPNALGQPQQVSYGATNYVSNVKYYPNGTLKSVNYGNGIKRDVSLDLTGRISGISDSKGTKDSLRISSSYDQNDNLSGLTDWLDRNNNIDNISYDGLDRLLTADGRWGRGQYRYDGLGNIVSRSIHGSTINYSYNHLNQLNNIDGGYRYNYAYDSRGNVINNGRYDLVFNDGNQVISAKNITYQYDGHNRRVQKGYEYTVYSQSGQLLTRLSPSNGLTEFIYLDNKLVAETTEMSVRYQHTDMLGTPVLETDSSGNTLTKSVYEPFGKRLGGEKAGIGYTGHLQDEDLGLTYMQARYYDPLIGRFYSNDPIGFRDIHSFNRYAYGNNNPYKYTDPDGKAAESWLNRPSGVSIQQNQDAYTGAAAIAVAVWTGGAASVSVTASASMTALEVTAVATSEGPQVKSRSSRPAPLKKAEGRSHSIVEKSGKDGQYTTHNADGTFKQYRGSGKDHGNVPRPNVKTNEGNVNVNPKTGESFPGRTDIRPAKKDEIPGG